MTKGAFRIRNVWGIMQEKSRVLPAKRPALLRYSVAALSVALVLLIRLLLSPLITQETPFLLLSVAILVGAWFGGLGPGLLATVLAALAVDYFFLAPRGSFTMPGLQAVPLGLFVLQGLTITLLIAALRSSRERAEASALASRSHHEDLRRSEERFRLLVGSVKEYAIFLLDGQGRVATWNEGAQRIKGYEAGEIIGEHFSVFYTDDDLRRGHPQEGLRIALEQGRYEHEGLRVRKDGSTFCASVLITALRDEGGTLRGFSKVTRDITERKRTEEELKQSEERYRAVVEQAAENIILADADTKRVLQANAALQRSLGYSPAELGRMTLYDIAAHGRADVGLDPKRAPAGEIFSGEGCYRRKDGSLIDVEVSASVISYGGKDALCIVAHDVSERKRTEADLRRSLDSLLALYEAGQVLGSTLEREQIASVLLEITRRISYLSAACIDLLEEDQQLCTTLRTIGSEDVWRQARSTPDAEAARRTALQMAQHQLFELRSEGADGTPLVGLYLPLLVRNRVIGLLEAFGSEALAENGTVETLRSLAGQGAIALENARLYEELAERERKLQDLVGELLVAQDEERRRVAYDVHDGLTQMLVAAHQRLQLFAEDYSPGSAEGRGDLEELVGLVQRTVAEARRVIANLRPTTLDDFGLATAVRLQLEDLRASGYSAEYEESLGEERLPAALETGLFRVVQEALTNVRKHAETDRIHVALGRHNGTIRLEVRDWGRGFRKDGGASKGGPGERVGLSSMRERVALLGGDLTIRSEPAEGTSVVAEIPLPVKEEATHGG